MRCPRLVLTLSLLLLLGISRAFRSPKSSPSLVTVISRKPSPRLYGFREGSKAIDDVQELVIGSLRKLPSPVLVAVTAVSSTLLVLEVSNFLVQTAFPEIIGLIMVPFMTIIGIFTLFGDWFIILVIIILFSPILDIAGIHLSSILAVDISYMIIYFAVQTLMTSNTTPAAPQRPPKIIDASPITEEDDPSLEEKRRLRDFDRRLKNRF